MNSVKAVVIAHNQYQQIQVELESLRKWNGIAKEDIIIIDNASSDELTEWLRQQSEYDYVICDEGIEPFSNILNTVMDEYVSEEDVLLLNPDYLVMPDAIAILEHVLDEARDYIGAVCPSVIEHGETGREESIEQAVACAEQVKASDHFDEKISMQPDCCLINNRLLHTIGRMDEDLVRPDNVMTDASLYGQKEGFRYVELEAACVWRISHTVNPYDQAYDQDVDDLRMREKWPQYYSDISSKQEAALIEIYRLKRRFDNLKYEMCSPEEGRAKGFFMPYFRSNEETLRLIIQEKKSLARFGDGEFSIVANFLRHKNQRLDNRLADRIKQVLSSKDDRLLIAIADNYGRLKQYNEQAADAIRFYMLDSVRKQHESLLEKDRIYSDAYITRPYVQYADNMTDAPKKRFDALKEIWKDKRIVIVEGSQTRLGVGNDLFDGVTTVRRILAPATSSFDRYDDLLKESLKVKDVDLFLLAIGPSAGVLAYDLTINGFQAVDVGHIDIEYEWFKAGKGRRVPVPGKYNNEVSGGDVVEDIFDKKYVSEIIADYSE